MKQKLLLLIAIVLTFASGARGADFSAVEFGTTFYFNILDDNRVEVTLEEIDGHYQFYKGYVKIPRTVAHPETGKVYDVTRIGDNAFGSCAEMTAIEIPYSITSIGKQAFTLCNGLKSLSIPASVESIGDQAFAMCMELKTLDISGPVKSFGTGIINNCYKLEEISGGHASDDGRCIIQNGKLIGVAIGGLTEYKIPNTVTTIGEGALASLYTSYVTLNSIVIPASVTRIESKAFEGSTGLSSLTVMNDDPSSITLETVGWYGPFEHAYPENHCDLYVPASAVDAYKAAPIWQSFRSIQAMPAPSPVEYKITTDYDTYYVPATPGYQSLLTSFTISEDDIKLSGKTLIGGGVGIEYSNPDVVEIAAIGPSEVPFAITTKGAGQTDVTITYKGESKTVSIHAVPAPTIVFDEEPTLDMYPSEIRYLKYKVMLDDTETDDYTVQELTDDFYLRLWPMKGQISVTLSSSADVGKEYQAFFGVTSPVIQDPRTHVFNPGYKYVFVNCVNKSVTGVETTAEDSGNISVRIFGNEIVVEGAPAGSLITIHDINGRLLYSGSRGCINVNHTGTMLLTVNGIAYKITL